MSNPFSLTRRETTASSGIRGVRLEARLAPGARSCCGARAESVAASKVAASSGSVAGFQESDVDAVQDPGEPVRAQAQDAVEPVAALRA